MSELKPCPFCGAEPVFPEPADTFGTCYEAGCEECCQARIDWQIIDCFDWPRDDLYESWNDETYQYGLGFVETVRTKAISAWNTRATSAELERLREALDFYACVDHYAGGCADDVVSTDRGAKARAALNGEGEG